MLSNLSPHTVQHTGTCLSVKRLTLIYILRVLVPSNSKTTWALIFQKCSWKVAYIVTYLVVPTAVNAGNMQPELMKIKDVTNRKMREWKILLKVKGDCADMAVLFLCLNGSLHKNTSLNVDEPHGCSESLSTLVILLSVKPVSLFWNCSQGIWFRIPKREVKVLILAIKG